jgi:hypothetical protein
MIELFDNDEFGNHGDAITTDFEMLLKIHDILHPKIIETYDFRDISPFFGVNSFAQIGIIDPYPQIHQEKRQHQPLIPVKHTDPVYPGTDSDFKLRPPIYIPNNEMLFKLMLS